MRDEKMTAAEARQRARQFAVDAICRTHSADLPSEVVDQLNLILADLRRKTRRSEAEQFREIREYKP